MQGEIDPIGLEIMWSRLIGIADEMWSTVLRTAVSTIVGAAQDFGCEILDAAGHSVAHANRSMPVFNCMMPITVRATMERFPVSQMQPGDVYATNDPWICAGHLDDIATVTPIFCDDRVVGFAATIAHWTSIGGALSSRTVRDFYEEGLHIPLLKLYDAGVPNETAFAFIRENVRTAEMVLVDLEAQVIANALGARRVAAFLRDYGLADLTVLAATIQDYSERAMRAAIAAIPDGVYASEVWADGFEAPVHLQGRVTVAGDEIEVDYAGSDPQQPRGGINCTWVYTLSHTVYPLKCLLSPTVPANEGTYRPMTVRAPEGSILNCAKPASVRERPRTGWHLHTLLFRALHAILPERVQAGNGLLDVLHCYGQERDGSFFNAHFFLGGGRGASRGRDGIGRNSFPSSARNVPVEVFEAQVPVLVRTRALRPGSAGAGQWRGAFGHHLELAVLPGYPSPVAVFVDPDRMRFAPPGLAGGEDGPLKTLLLNGRQLSLDELSEGRITLASPSDRLAVWQPGGAGYGPPHMRDPALRESDERSGLGRPSELQPEPEGPWQGAAPKGAEVTL